MPEEQINLTSPQGAEQEEASKAQEADEATEGEPQQSKDSEAQVEDDEEVSKDDLKAHLSALEEVAKDDDLKILLEKKAFEYDKHKKELETKRFDALPKFENLTFDGKPLDVYKASASEIQMVFKAILDFNEWSDGKKLALIEEIGSARGRHTESLKIKEEELTNVDRQRQNDEWLALDGHLKKIAPELDTTKIGKRISELFAGDDSEYYLLKSMTWEGKINLVKQVVKEQNLSKAGKKTSDDPPEIHKAKSKGTRGSNETSDGKKVYTHAQYAKMAATLSSDEFNQLLKDATSGKIILK